MPLIDDVVHGALGAGRSALAKAGVLASPVRDLQHATRSLTVGRPLGEVRAFWADPELRARALATGSAGGPLVAPGAGTAAGDTGAEPATVAFGLPDGGTGRVELRPSAAGTVMRLTLDLGTVVADGRPRIGNGAATLALRALHGAKALMEVGEAPTLTANPAGRPEPDPYATTGPDAGTAA